MFFKKFNVDYRRLPRYIVIIAALAALAVFNFFYLQEYISSNSEVINNYSLRDEDMNKTREAAVAGLFYPADVYQLSSELDGYLKHAGPSLSRRPHILIVPHAGYMYSAKVAAQAYQKLQPFGREIRKVILLGPSHRVTLNGAALSSADSFRTPLGKVPVDREITAVLAQDKSFTYNDLAHKNEHSLEVQLPFLQKTLQDFSIVPVVYGTVSPEALASTLRPLLDRNDTLLVISADLSHYLDYETARKVDEHTAALVAESKPLDPHLSCGAAGINTALLLARELGLQPQMLDMASSGDVGGDMQSVVGYAAWVFNRGAEPQKQLTPLEREVENLDNFGRHNRQALLDIARKGLEEAVLHGKKYAPSRQDYADVLFDKGAAFVTLTKKGELRGCIGSLIAGRAIALDIAANAYAAALEDVRFPAVKAEELPDLSFSISLLTDYERLHFKNEEDVLKQIVSGKDGLVIRDGDRQGVLLPSVWEQIPDKREFLNNLKIKAGLSPVYWSDKVKIYRFRVVEIKADEN